MLLAIHFNDGFYPLLMENYMPELVLLTELGAHLSFQPSEYELSADHAFKFGMIGAILNLLTHERMSARLTFEKDSQNFANFKYKDEDDKVTKVTSIVVYFMTLHFIVTLILLPL